ncbi:MAG TPA: response regulator, partial [Saprospiraceae bacterium]|nr:response regulator [Saprospiraceae bacterium]
MKDKAKIFIIDDDELITSSLSKLLKNEGYRVQVENEDFHLITPQVESFSPDLVLLDIKLPGRSGIEILQELKGLNIHTPVIMLTSDDSAETAVKCMKMGAVDYLTKPFNIEEVRIVINGIVEKEK